MAQDIAVVGDRFWDDRAVKPMPDHMKLLASYLISTKHLSLVGVGALPYVYAAEDLGWGDGKVASVIAELQDANFLRYDAANKWVWVVRYLHFRPFRNQNSAKNGVKAVVSVSRGLSFYPEFIRNIRHADSWVWNDFDFASKIPVAPDADLLTPSWKPITQPKIVVDNTVGYDAMNKHLEQRAAILRPLDDGHHGIIDTVLWALDHWDKSCGVSLGTDIARMPATTKTIADRLVEISADDDDKRRAVWVEFCRKVQDSDFINGRVSGSYGMRFGTLIRQDKFANVLQGTYDNRRPARARARFGGM